MRYLFASEVFLVIGKSKYYLSLLVSGRNIPVVTQEVTAAQARAFLTELTTKDFNNMVNALNNCYKCNNRGHVRKDCPSRV